MNQVPNQTSSNARIGESSNLQGNFNNPVNKKRIGDQTKSAITFAILILAIVVPIRVFIAKPFVVSGTSMYPTFDSWHYLIVDQFTYRFEKPRRGDVIVFRYPQKPSRFFIKRVIGLPGETLRLEGTKVIIKNEEHPNGFVLKEPYISPENAKSSNITVTLGEGEYFVMGDNRRASADSRFWGPLKDSYITGRAILRLFPFAEAGILPGSVKY